MHLKITTYRLRKRCPFLLLEILFAIALIVLASSFLLSTPLKIYQKHLEDLKEVELARIANHLFISIQAQLKDKHPWNSLKNQPSELFPLSDISLNIDSVLNTTYQCGYKLWIKKEKEGQGECIYRLLRCSIYFSSGKQKPKKFSYLIFTSASPQKRFAI